MAKERLERKFGPLKYRKAASAVYNDSAFRWNGILFHIYALVSSKTGENLPGRDAGFTKQVKKVPKEILGDIDSEQEVKASEAASRGELWFIKVGTDSKGLGWMWSKGDGQPEPKGAAKVQAIHEVLTWLQKFASSNKAHGAQAYYIEINNNTIG